MVQCQSLFFLQIQEANFHNTPTPSTNDCSPLLLLRLLFLRAIVVGRPTQRCNWCQFDSGVVRANLTVVPAADAGERIYLDLSHLICIRRRRTGWLSAEARSSGNIIHTVLLETYLTNVLGRRGSAFYHFEFLHIFQSSTAQKMH